MWRYLCWKTNVSFSRATKTSFTYQGIYIVNSVRMNLLLIMLTVYMCVISFLKHLVYQRKCDCIYECAENVITGWWTILSFTNMCQLRSVCQVIRLSALIFHSFCNILNFIKSTFTEARFWLYCTFVVTCWTFLKTCYFILLLYYIRLVTFTT